MQWTSIGRQAAAAVAVVLLAVGHAPADGLTDLAARAVSSDETTSSAAIAALRDAGPAGLDALFEVHQAKIKKALDPKSVDRSNVDVATLFREDRDLSAIRQAIDAVGQQRDCFASRLYWYTEFHAAKAEAQRTGKPILSLRLLGNLTDEYSCANSRFFRAILYPNAAVSQALRERFVLHWQSVRAVPIVTIDFGDGRKLMRTVTGNSVHYVLDADGRPIDALPGLYGPKTFLHELEQAEEVFRSFPADGYSPWPLVKKYHEARLAQLDQDWAADLDRLNHPPAAEGAHRGGQSAARQVYKKTKHVVAKAPMEAEMRPLGDPSLREAAADELWARIAALHKTDELHKHILDATSAVLIARQHPTAGAAAPLAVGKRAVESPMMRMMGQLRSNVILDTVRNEYLLHRQIHAWLAAQPIDGLDAFNERVYAEAFLTPTADPWFGLIEPDAYSALQNNGVFGETAQLKRRAN